VLEGGRWSGAQGGLWKSISRIVRSGLARSPVTLTGPVLDLPPSGRPVRVSEIVIFRVVDGKIVEAWAEYDELGLRQQVGALPAPILTQETMPPGMPPSE
jgi:SnoaL-like polyketide cyclase